MTKTEIKAGAARVRLVLSLIDWQEVADIITDGMRILWAAVQLITTALALAGAIAWEHRARIRAALVTAIARTYIAGIATRRVIDAISSRSAALLPRQPLASVAPITATLAATREALERLVRRLYPVAA